jgi:hypothetical protein
MGTREPKQAHEQGESQAFGRRHCKIEMADVVGVYLTTDLSTCMVPRTPRKLGFLEEWARADEDGRPSRTAFYLHLLTDVLQVPWTVIRGSRIFKGEKSC